MRTLIAAEPFGEFRMVDEAQADGGDRWSQKSACGALQHQSHKDDRKSRRKPDGDGAEGDDDDAQAEQSSLRPDCVKKLASGELGQQAGNSASA
jgi:hypothetical protein